MERQKLLQGFIAQHELLDSYAYTRFDLSEVYEFSKRLSDPDFLPQTFWDWRFLNKAEKHRYHSRYRQTVLLLHKLNVHFLNRLSPAAFPESYRRQLRKMQVFLNSLPLEAHAVQIREQRSAARQTRSFLKLLEARSKDGSLQDFWDGLFEFEVFLSVSKGIRRQGFVFPQITGNEFLAEGLWHPLLKDPAPVSFTATQQVIVLSGPNMSGKSTFLKATAILVYLTHLGFAVPAAQAKVPLFDTFGLYVQHADKLESGYSHFLNEILQLKAMVEAAVAGKKCFAVFDELFRGTNEADALAVSTATINGLTRFINSFFFISTHLQGLKEAAMKPGSKIAAWRFGCELQEGLPVFAYQLQKGWSDVTVGQLLFEKEGLPDLLRGSGV